MIPEKIHFIWITLDSDGIPELFKNCITSAVRNTNCQVFLHTDLDINLPGVITRKREFDCVVKGVKYNPTDIVDTTGNRVGKRVSHIKDIVRLQILLEEGGIYSDCDTLWLKNPWSLLQCKAFIGFDNKGYKVLCNAIIGAEKDHPAIKQYLDWTLSIFPPKKYWIPANPYKLWAKRDDVSFIESALLFPIPHWKDRQWIASETGKKKLQAAIACHLYISGCGSPKEYMPELFNYLQSD